MPLEPVAYRARIWVHIDSGGGLRAEIIVIIVEVVNSLSVNIHVCSVIDPICEPVWVPEQELVIDRVDIGDHVIVRSRKGNEDIEPSMSSPFLCIIVIERVRIVKITYLQPSRDSNWSRWTEEG